MADDEARRESVARALRLVRKGAVVERAKIFANMPKEPGVREFQRRLLNKLVSARAIRKTVKEGETGTFYVLDQIEAIDRILATDNSLIEFIWPGSAGPPTVEDSAAVTDAAKQEQAASEPVPVLSPYVEGVTPTGATPVALDPFTIEETNRLLRELVMTMSAALQSVIYSRDQIDTMKKELGELNQRNQATDTKLSQVLTKLGE